MAGQTLTAEDFRQIPVLRGVSGNFLDLNRGSVVKRRFQPGEVICQEGEFGSTAFYILKGKVDIFLATPMAHSSSHAVGTKGGWRAALHKVTRLLPQRETRARSRRPRRATSRSTPRSTWPTTSRPPSSGRGSCSAR
jgi:hypothetical protein